MRAVKSFGMLMDASDASNEKVELLVPPDGSLPGQRIWFGSENDHQNQPPPATPNQVQKKRIWELVQPHLKTDDAWVADNADICGCDNLPTSETRNHLLIIPVIMLFICLPFWL
ncbi:uncharacterized protein LOC126791206 [Argentina anserina]|uniref:uncharacterized protein LOC126791206 n=1 Tax=Argentina anserina TaxID=57926 RepID=UPI0021765BEB|nr:uncharacterized protein LOC126791206 [Potentilla anserina]